MADRRKIDSQAMLMMVLVYMVWGLQQVALRWWSRVTER
jgi:hypothetical protein